MEKIISSFLMAGVLFFAAASSAHKGVKHGTSSKQTKLPQEKEDPRKVFSKINGLYLSEVRPLFQRSCLDCHGSGNRLPLYADWPLVSSLIQQDISEAKEHLDMSNDFPFGGHGSPAEDLIAIEESVRENAMPPRRYRLMHWNSGLSEKEKEIVFYWVKEGLRMLNEPLK